MDIDRAISTAEVLIRHFEGCVLTPYLCPAGIPSIGYGSTYYLDGVHVAMSDGPITVDMAEQLLARTVREVYWPGVLSLCPQLATSSEGRVAAIIDFAYNLGTGNLKASTLRVKINQNAWGAVPTELRKWVKGGGRVLRGLVLRREAEVALI